MIPPALTETVRAAWQDVSMSGLTWHEPVVIGDEVRWMRGARGLSVVARPGGVLVWRKREGGRAWAVTEPLIPAGNGWVIDVVTLWRWMEETT